MVQVKRISDTGFGGSAQQNIEDKINAFFRMESLSRDDVVHVEMFVDWRGAGCVVAYIFYEHQTYRR
jgi:hypothetical protein